MDERTLDWFYVRTTDVFTEYAPLSEPEPKRRARYEKIATLAEKLADEIGRDEWLRASITVEDYEIRRQALEQSGSLEEVEDRGLSISPNAGVGGEDFTTLTLHSYLRGLAAYLRQDAITPSLQSLYEGYSPSGRALRFKAFSIKWCYGLLEDLEISGASGRSTANLPRTTSWRRWSRYSWTSMLPSRPVMSVMCGGTSAADTIPARDDGVAAVPLGRFSIRPMRPPQTPVPSSLCPSRLPHPCPGRFL